jgi:PAS domain S-box-containing protein
MVNPGWILFQAGLLLLLVQAAMSSPSDATGLPVSRYLPSSQSMSDFCLSTTHGLDRQLFVGNQDGLLEFDGQRWRLLHTPARTQVRSVLALPGGRVAWGGVNEFGLFHVDEQGNWAADTLSALLPAAAPHFREVRSILDLSHGLYFHSKELLARWADGRLSVLEGPGETGAAVAVGDELYLQTEDQGLLRLAPGRLPRQGQGFGLDAFDPVLGPERFRNGNRLIFLLPLGGGRLLAGTRFKGLFVLEGGRVRELPELSGRVRDLDLFHGLRLRDGRMALATLQGGVLLLDHDLGLDAVLDEHSGLPGPLAFHLSQDEEGNLWVAGNEGLTQFGMELPYRIYARDSGLQGQVNSLAWHDGTLFAGTTRGIFRLAPDSDRLEPVLPRGGICWKLLSTRHGLLAIVGAHLIQVDKPGKPVVLTGQPTHLEVDAADPGLVWVGVAGELRELRWEGGGWVAGSTLPVLHGEVTSLGQRGPDELWVGTRDMGLWRMRRQGESWRAGQVKGWGPGEAKVWMLGDQPLVVHGGRAWDVDEGGALRPSARFTAPDGWSMEDGVQISPLPDGKWCVAFDQGMALGSWKDDRPVWDLGRFALAGSRAGRALADPTSRQIWVVAGDRLVRFLPDAGLASGHGHATLRVRGLELGGRERAGSAGLPEGEREFRGGGPLRLEVACSHLCPDGAVLYSFRVGDREEDWTPWTSSGSWRLEWLQPGRHVLWARVRSGRHHEQEVRLATLVVPTPLLEQTWLRLGAVLALLGLVLALSRRRARRLKAVNDVLQAEVQERRRAEAALRVSETRYRGLFEASKDAIFLMDGERYLEANPAALQMFGLERERLAGTPPGSLSPATQPDGRDSHEKAGELLARALAGEAFSFEWEHVRGDGTHFLVEVSLSPLRLEGEDRVLAILRDVSERHLLEGQLRQSQKMEAVGRLAGGVAHDFNNILVVILGQCDLLLMSLDAHDPVRDEVQQVRDAAQRAAQLTRQLLVFSRRSTLHPQRVSLNNVLGDLEKMLRRVIGEDIRIRMDLAPDLARVSVDPGQMDQVILNLVVNARDAMKKGGDLVVRTRNVQPGALLSRETGLAEGVPQVLLSISDTGHGMAPEVQAHIFEPFFTTKEAGQGTGLGLATVYGIVTQSGGRIRVQSEVGRGTTFHVYLPAVAGESAGAAGEPLDIPGSGGGELLLVVEDEAAVREVLLRTLLHSGYQVETAIHGRDALEKLSGGLEPRLILSDVVMPELGGFELAREVRARGIQVPMVLMTGYSDRDLGEVDVDGLDLSFLHKPFGPSVLLREVRHRLDGSGD